MMGAIWLRAWAEIRARWRAALSLALLVGISGGVVMAAAQGARRTDTAYPRFFRETRGFDIGVPDLDFVAGGAKLDLAKLRARPDVIESVEIHFFETDQNIEVLTSPDPRLGREMMKVKILEGRAAHPDRAEEIVVGFPIAERKNIRLGQTLDVAFVDSGSDPDRPKHGSSVRLKVVGIGAAHWDFPPNLTFTPVLFGTPALFREQAERAQHFGGVAFRLRGGAAAVSHFDAELERQAGGKFYFVFRTQDHIANVQRSLHLQAVALWLLAGLAGVSALLIFSQTLSRQIFIESSDHPVLRSLGMSSTQLWAVGMLRAAVITLAGAALALAVAVVLSPLTPIGLARIAEPHPGFSLDWTVLGTGSVASVLVVAALAAVPAWKAARSRGSALGVAEPGGRERPSRAVAAFARAGFPASAVAGVRMALEPGRGRTAVPVRTTLAGVTLGVVALATAFSFGASLQHLMATPRLFGWAWDAQFNLGLPFPEEQPDEAAVAAAVKRAEAGFARARSILEADPRIEALSYGDFGLPGRIDGLVGEAVEIDGDLTLPIVEGRAPRNGREVAVGTETLRALGKRVGDRADVSIQGVGRRVEMRIVGRPVFPPLSDNIGLGRGVLVHRDAFRLLAPEFAGQFGEAEPYAMVRFAPGVDKRAAIDDIRKELAGSVIERARRPRELVNFGRVDNLPVLLAGGVAAVALATLAHTLVSSIRRRRRDLAILKTIGFVRGQVSRSVAWQATTIAAIAVAIGVPAGIAAGRWAWTLFADRLGIVSVPVVEIPIVLLIIPGTLLLANLIAILPARAAARMQPALALRTE